MDVPLTEDNAMSYETEDAYLDYMAMRGDANAPTFNEEYVKNTLTKLSVDALYLRDFNTDDGAIDDICESLNAVVSLLKHMDMLYDIDGVLVVNRDY